jgi:AcrR family transcriptional regulator
LRKIVMPKDAPPRRRNAQATREAIIEAARVRFMNNAYEQLSLRDIASAAGIDPALVIRYFGSKEGLFERVLTTEVSGPGPEVTGDRSTFGTRLAAAFVQSDTVHTRYETINTAIWSAASPTAAKIVKRDIEERFVKPLAAALGGADAEIRAALIVSLLVGATILHRMLAVPPLDGEDLTLAAPRLAAVLQHLADGD